MLSMNKGFYYVEAISSTGAEEKQTGFNMMFNVNATPNISIRVVTMLKYLLINAIVLHGFQDFYAVIIGLLFS